MCQRKKNPDLQITASKNLLINYEMQKLPCQLGLSQNYHYILPEPVQQIHHPDPQPSAE